MDSLMSPLPPPTHRAIASTRSELVPNFNFISDWGDSLKRNVDASWRERFMKSTYAAGNDEVYAGFTTDFDITKERAFHEWMLRQKTYYGDLMQPAQRAEFERAFAAASTEQRREMLEGLRQLSAVARPDALKSVSQVDHCAMAKSENPELTAMTMEMVRIKTMGHTPAVVHTEDLPPPGQRMPPDAFRGGAATSTAEKAQQSSVRPTSACGLSRVDLALGSMAAEPRPSSARPHVSRAVVRPGSGRSNPPEAMRPLSAMAHRQLSGLQRPGSAAPLGRAAKPKTVAIETYQSKVR